MKFNSTTELHRYIGKCSYFKKKIELNECLYLIESNDSLNPSSDRKSHPFSIKIHPNGFSLTDATNELFGFQFHEIDFYALERISENEMHFLLHLKLSGLFRFNIDFQKFNTLVILLRSLPIRFSKDTRNQAQIKSDICTLSEEFAIMDKHEPFGIDLLDISTFGNVFNLYIDEEEIHFKDKLMKINQAIGFSYGITLNKAYGAVVSRNYEIIIHTKDKSSINIFFSKKAGVNPNIEEDQLTFTKIINILFNLITRKYVVEWIDKFAQSQVIEYKDVNISREGILVKKGEKPILMYWDEIIVLPHIVRWKYTNTVFAEINGYYDRRTVMLMKFCDWLLEDKKRLIKLIGTSILVVDESHQKNPVPQ